MRVAVDSTLAFHTITEQERVRHVSAMRGGFATRHNGLSTLALKENKTFLTKRQ